MSRLTIASTVLAAVSIAGIAGLTGFAIGQSAERRDSNVDRQRAVERVELKAERRISQLEDEHAASLRDVKRRVDARADELNAWVTDYVTCITDLMTEDGFFDTGGYTEDAAIARCNEETRKPPSRDVDA